jgi:hypothetical protein
MKRCAVAEPRLSFSAPLTAEHEHPLRAHTNETPASPSPSCPPCVPMSPPASPGFPLHGQNICHIVTPTRLTPQTNTLCHQFYFYLARLYPLPRRCDHGYQLVSSRPKSSFVPTWLMVRERFAVPASVTTVTATDRACASCATTNHPPPTPQLIPHHLKGITFRPFPESSLISQSPSTYRCWQAVSSLVCCGSRASCAHARWQPYWVDSPSGKTLVAPSAVPSLVSNTDDGLSSRDSDAESTQSDHWSPGPRLLLLHGLTISRWPTRCDCLGWMAPTELEAKNDSHPPIPHWPSVHRTEPTQRLLSSGPT